MSLFTLALCVRVRKDKLVYWISTGIVCQD
jgi:hypothetical protein